MDDEENPALSHLQKIKIDRRHPRDQPDYLEQLREKRIEREAKEGVDYKVRGIISKKNLSNLQKLQSVQIQTKKVE